MVTETTRQCKQYLTPLVLELRGRLSKSEPIFKTLVANEIPFGRHGLFENFWMMKIFFTALRRNIAKFYRAIFSINTPRKIWKKFVFVWKEINLIYHLKLPGSAWRTIGATWIAPAGTESQIPQKTTKIWYKEIGGITSKITSKPSLADFLLFQSSKNVKAEVSHLRIL